MKIKTENVNEKSNIVKNEINDVRNDSDSEVSGDINPVKINDLKEDTLENLDRIKNKD